ncbi:pyridoxal phosphate-dependent aminotransferase family protein [Marinoscillum sp. 108]|uniref:Aminotransferase class I/II-fold pyridoxal phosphate-dependent enzyme n=1 Tax=Marinoscillum luteum TaxID=861051 RepID=A0ABW7NDP0_9BACT|nr:pyridoxal phosphate-dependent aminotransferase family protein [Marinoscillum sp. 108]VXD13369.1 8-amino-7-oxononanoate synthase [Marinoscillum sp. 108]
MSSILKNRYQSYQEPQKVKALNLYPFFRNIQSGQDAEVMVEGKKVLMFGSNSYLGLTTHPKIKEAAIAAIKKYGSSLSGSRYMNGTSDMHTELEGRLAKFLNKEAVALYSTGFQVNIGVLPTIAGKNDYLFLDRLNHASIFEGAKLSPAQSVIFRHNNMESLEQKLSKVPIDAFKFIVVDGIFSMEGNIVKLPEIVKLAKKYNAAVMTDCAHAIGVIGENGAGTSNHFGLTDDVDIIGGTLSKSFAALGGFCASDADTINYLKHHSKSMIFAASITPPSIASALAALDIMETDDSHRLKLWDNTHYTLKVMKELGFDTGASETPIVPIFVRDDLKAYKLTRMLFDRGVFVNPVVSPGVSPEDSLIRFSIMSTHTHEQIDRAAEILFQAAKEVDLFQTA